MKVNLFIILLVVLCSNCRGEISDDDYLDYLAGDPFPAAHHFYYKIPTGYLPDDVDEVKDCSGFYQGTSSYKGDRRYGAFSVLYKLKINVLSRSNITVDLISKYRKASAKEWVDEAPVMFIKNVKCSGGMIWGDRYFVSKNRDSITTSPFIAVFVVRISDRKNGVILIGRYEGDVFVPKTSGSNKIGQ